MNEELPDARHLTFANLELLWRGGVPLILPVDGTPACQLEFDPTAGRITLITEYRPPEPNLARLQHIGFEALYIDGREVARISVRIADNVHGAYGLLATIADELQIAKSPLAQAVSAGVEQYKDMLVSRGSLTREEEIGLVGELIFLDYLIHTVGAGPGVAAWRGPYAEEHDFVFDDHDIEVKTTASERRRHIISGTGQLVPRHSASLRMLSLQVTTAGQGDGLTLPGWVATVRTLAGGHVAQLDDLLRTVGWNVTDADLYATNWGLRNRPRAYSIGPDFPAITDTVLQTVIPHAGCLSDISYRLDVTDLKFDALPAPLSGFVEEATKP